MANLAGADGCPAGWILASERGVVVVPRLERETFEVLGVDMPIGLPETGPRACDREARRFLGARRSSVFPTPARACLDAVDYAHAQQLSRAAVRVGLSQQGFHLIPKIRELDALVTPADDEAVIEIHPECAFVRMNSGEPLPPKKTAAGAAIRDRLLTAIFGSLPRPPRGARPDDLRDAFAVLWSTDRFVRGAHVTFGDGARDAHDLPMRIVS